MKFCGQVGFLIRMNRLHFGEDPDPDPTTRIFKSDSSPLRDWAKKTIHSTISQKVVDGFGRNLVDELVQ